MNITKRIKAIGGIIPKKRKIVDIGCDHALLSIYLCLHNEPLKLMVSDISSEALDQGKVNIKKYKLDNKIITKLGDGLEVIEQEDIDTIVISGLGGSKINEILIKNILLLNNIEYIILQPNNNIYEVRKKVTQLGYIIKEEKLLKENNIIYTIILFKKGNKRYSYKELYFGPILLKECSNLFIELYNNKLNKYINIYNKVPIRYISKKIYYKYHIMLIENILKYKKRNQ